MADLLSNYGLFLAKIITVVIAIGFVIGMIANVAAKQKERKGELQVESLSDKIRETRLQLEQGLLSGKALKEAQKRAKKESKEHKPKDKRLFVLDFKGSMDAREVASLRREVTAILQIAKPDDEVLVRLESGGGVVHGYGLAAAQLKRIKAKGIQLTVAVDKVAASGGYMMACIADRLVAAPFAVLGSIGVIAQLPNFNKLLKKNNIEFEQVTAGEYKRTLTIFGENTEQGRKKFKEEIEVIHQMFKDFVKDNRADLDIDAVATGEVWYGQKALEKGLVDELSTSDDLLLVALEDKELVKVHYKAKPKLGEKLAERAQGAIEKATGDWVQKSRFWTQ